MAQVVPPHHAKSARDGDPGFAQNDIRRGLGEAFLLNDRVNQLLLENLDAGAWRAKPPGLAPGGGVRTIAAIFSHMHNIRRKWLRLSAPHLKLPPELDRARCTQKQGTGRPGERASSPHHPNIARDGDPDSRKSAAEALRESAQLCAEMIADTHVKEFVRDSWAKPWGLAVQATAPSAQKTKTRAEAGAGISLGAAAMLAYMVSHEAHHRGQVCMLAHQMGYRLPMKVMSRMWAWEGLAVPGTRASSPHHPNIARDGDPDSSPHGRRPVRGDPASRQKTKADPSLPTPSHENRA